MDKITTVDIQTWIRVKELVESLGFQLTAYDVVFELRGLPDIELISFATLERVDYFIMGFLAGRNK